MGWLLEIENPASEGGPVSGTILGDDPDADDLPAQRNRTGGIDPDLPRRPINIRINYENPPNFRPGPLQQVGFGEKDLRFREGEDTPESPIVQGPPFEDGRPRNDRSDLVRSIDMTERRVVNAFKKDASLDKERRRLARRDRRGRRDFQVKVFSAAEILLDGKSIDSVSAPDGPSAEDFVP